MSNRTKRKYEQLLPVQKRIVTALENLDRSIRWLAEKMGVSYTMLWQKIWVNEKIDTNIVEKISSVLQKENNEFTVDYFMPSPSTIHFSMPGHISDEQAQRIEELAKKLEQISRSPKDTQIVLTLVNTILDNNN